MVLKDATTATRSGWSVGAAGVFIRPEDRRRRRSHLIQWAHHPPGRVPAKDRGTDGSGGTGHNQDGPQCGQDAVQTGNRPCQHRPCQDGRHRHRHPRLAVRGRRARRHHPAPVRHERRRAAPRGASSADIVQPDPGPGSGSRSTARSTSPRSATSLRTRATGSTPRCATPGDYPLGRLLVPLLRPSRDLTTSPRGVEHDRPGSVRTAAGDDRPLAVESHVAAVRRSAEQLPSRLRKREFTGLELLLHDAGQARRGGQQGRRRGPDPCPAPYGATVGRMTNTATSS
jgi:hypothetical protein